MQYLRPRCFIQRLSVFQNTYTHTLIYHTLMWREDATVHSVPEPLVEGRQPSRSGGEFRDPYAEVHSRDRLTGLGQAEKIFGIDSWLFFASCSSRKDTSVLRVCKGQLAACKLRLSDAMMMMILAHSCLVIVVGRPQRQETRPVKKIISMVEPIIWASFFLSFHLMPRLVSSRRLILLFISSSRHNRGAHALNHASFVDPQT